MAGLDLAYINGNLKQTIHEICQSLDEGFNVIPDEQLAVFIDNNQKFITRAIEVASSFIREQEQLPLRDFSMFKAKKQEPDNGLEMTSRLDCN